MIMQAHRPHKRDTQSGAAMTVMRRPRLIWIAVCLALTLAAFLAVSRIATDVFLAEARSRAVASLGLTIQALDGHLRRFEAVPDLLADQERVLDLVQNPGDKTRAQAINAWLQARNTALDASDIYIMTPDGVTIAASNHAQSNSFIGQNFTYRPYFTAALAGQKGRFYAIGTTSGVRGYYFAAPIRDAANSVAGVIAVKIGLDVIEAEWRAQETVILVTDPEGIVFLSTKPEQLYQGLLPLTIRLNDVEHGALASFYAGVRSGCSVHDSDVRRGPRASLRPGLGVR